MPTTTKPKSRARRFFTSKWTIGIGSLIVLILIIHVVRHKKPTYQEIPVKTGSITEVVSVTGNTTPVESVSLGFSASGTIASIHGAVGTHVAAGSVLASLNSAGLGAQLDQAKANVDAENAKLQGLEAGAQPANIASSQAAVDAANQSLTNLYASISDASNTAYANATDAVRNQLRLFFTNPETLAPQLTYQTTASQAAANLPVERSAITADFTNWQKTLATTSASSSSSDLESLLTNELSYLTYVRTFMTDASATLTAANSLDATTLSAYKTDVATATTEVNTAISNLNTISNNIASQKLAITQAEAALTVTKTGATSQDIAAQNAQVEAAQANVASIQAELSNDVIVAPQSGVITQFDAKIGQTATPGSPLISIISDSNFEVDAYVPETDIGKVGVGNPVDMTFDAFPGETFQGSVVYIDPAETVTQGVVDYKVTVDFSKNDPRIKSGLTVNLDIETQTKDNVLILPQYAILQNDQGTFVETLDAKGAPEQVPVTLGIQDQSGNVEVTSGVTSGENVLNIGLKQ